MFYSRIKILECNEMLSVLILLCSNNFLKVWLSNKLKKTDFRGRIISIKKLEETTQLFPFLSICQRSKKS